MSTFSLDTRRNLGVHKTRIRLSGRFLNVLCTFNLCLVSLATCVHLKT